MFPSLNWRTRRVSTQLIRDGKLYLSLKDAIDLALENNLDLAIARYNLPIADTDILRTQAGGFFRGVNTGVVQGTPGGGVGGFGTGAPGAGAGGTTGGAGGAGAGASGLVQSTLGRGTPCLRTIPFTQRQRRRRASDYALANLQIYGVPSLQLNTGQVNSAYSQAFPTGTSINFRVQQQSADHEQSLLQPVPVRRLRLLSLLDSSSNCSRASVSARTCAICASRATTRRFPTSLSKTR